jgi:hypothetical protein
MEYWSDGVMVVEWWRDLSVDIHLLGCFPEVPAIFPPPASFLSSFFHPAPEVRQSSGICPEFLLKI